MHGAGADGEPAPHFRFRLGTLALCLAETWAFRGIQEPGAAVKRHRVRAGGEYAGAIELRPLPLAARHAHKASRWIAKKTDAGFETSKTPKRWEDSEHNLRAGAQAAREAGRDLSARKLERRADEAREMLRAFDPARFEKAHDASEEARRIGTPDAYARAIAAWQATIARGRDRDFSDSKVARVYEQVAEQISAHVEKRDHLLGRGGFWAPAGRPLDPSQGPGRLRRAGS